MIDPHDKGDMHDLAEAVWDSRWRYEPFVNQIRRVVEDFTGPGFGSEVKRDKLPLNRGMLALVTVLHKLISGEVRTLHTTMDPQLEIASLEREAAMNEWIIKERVSEQLVKWVLSGLVSPQGILKVGISPYQSSSYDDPGKLILRNISHNDWVQDMTATQQCDWAFCGHKFRVPIERVLADMSISDERLQQMNDMPYRPYNEFGNEKISAISSGRRRPPPGRKYLALWEIFLPEEQLLLTFVGTDGGNTVFDPEPLKILHWNGPTNGPYHLLQFHPVHDNSMGFPPVEFYRELHRSINIIGNKWIRDAEGYKRILLVNKSDNPADVDAITRARHGQAVGVDRPDAAKEVTMSVPDQKLGIVLMQLLTQCNTQGGGYEQMAGINQPAPTATQDELKSNNASEMVGSMQQAVVGGLVKVFTDCSDWMFSPRLGDPMQNIPTQRPLGDTGFKIPFNMTSDLHEGDTPDFRIAIAPYSFKYKTPDEELADVIQATQLVAQWGQMASSGMPIDVGYGIKLIARLKNSPFLERLWNPGLPSQAPDQQQIAQRGQPTQGVQNNTTTTHIRQDRGGPPDPHAQMLSMMQAMPDEGGGQTQQTAAGAA